MELAFDDSQLERLAFDQTFTGKWSPATVRSYRRCLNYLMQAPDRRAIYNFPGFCLEKLKGKKKGLHSLRLNDQYRLILSFEECEGKEVIKVIAIEDYH